MTSTVSSRQPLSKAALLRALTCGQVVAQLRAREPSRFKVAHDKENLRDCNYDRVLTKRVHAQVRGQQSQYEQRDQRAAARPTA